LHVVWTNRLRKPGNGKSGFLDAGACDLTVKTLFASYESDLEVEVRVIT